MSTSFDINQSESKEETPENIRSALQILAERCNSAGIAFTDASDPELRDVDVKVALPCGRSTREVALADLDDLIDFLKVSFEDFSFVGKFAAIVSFKTGVIEAPLSMPNSLARARNRFRNLLLVGESSRGNPVHRRERVISAATEDRPMTISIRRVSAAAAIICQPSEALNLSLVIKNTEITTQDRAVSLLQEVANELFFSLDVQAGLYVSLVRQESRNERQALSKENIEFVFPGGLMTVPQWSSIGTLDQPLICPCCKFLAYYQVVEYYYPTFSNFDVTRRLQAIIKHPSFRVENSSDIERIISTIKTRESNNSSEKDQLKATLRQSIDEQSFLNFFTETNERSAFFLAKNKGITSKTINIQNKSAELFNQVAERIYDIRCKIVHIKGDDHDGEVELLLPYSTEADKLSHEIELMRFVAQQVIIYCSK